MPARGQTPVSTSTVFSSRIYEYTRLRPERLTDTRSLDSSTSNGPIQKRAASTQSIATGVVAWWCRMDSKGANRIRMRHQRFAGEREGRTVAGFAAAVRGIDMGIE